MTENKRMTREDVEATIEGGSPYFRGVDLQLANLSGMNLRGIDFADSDLSGADLSGADLRGTRFYRTSLGGTDLEGANLEGAFLRYARFESRTDGILQIVGLYPYAAMVVPLPRGWEVSIGCWRGTVDELATLAASDNADDWPEAYEEEIPERRVLLEAIIAMVRAHMKYSDHYLQMVQKRWAAPAAA